MSETRFPDPVPTLPDLAVAIIDGCLEPLDGPSSIDEEATVHLVRVSTKRLRAAWHLVGALVEKKAARRRRRALQDLSGRLAGSRDRSVLLALVESLEAEETSLGTRKAWETAREILAAPPPPSTSPEDRTEAEAETAWEFLRTGLLEERRAWESLAGTERSRMRQALRLALRRSRQEARRDTREALDHQDPEVWHEWRKAMKRYRYQREFLAAVQQRELGIRDRRISHLGTCLGDRNDLANLASLVDRWRQAERIDATTHRTLRRTIGGREAALMRHIRRLGRRFLRSS